MSYVLEQGEIIILRDERVTDNYGAAVTLLLTNRNIITVRGINGKDFYYPLSQLRERDGTPNVLVGKGPNGKSHLELYFEQYQLVFAFKGLLAEKKWASAITKAYKARMKEIARSNRKTSARGRILSPIKDKIDTAKDALSSDRKSAPYKCPFCGAIAKGRPGEEVKCGYCESTFMIK